MPTSNHLSSDEEFTHVVHVECSPRIKSMVIFLYSGQVDMAACNLSHPLWCLLDEYLMNNLLWSALAQQSHQLWPACQTAHMASQDSFASGMGWASLGIRRTCSQYSAQPWTHSWAHAVSIFRNLLAIALLNPMVAMHHISLICARTSACVSQDALGTAFPMSSALLLNYFPPN